MRYFSLKARSVITVLFMLVILLSLFPPIATTDASAHTKSAPCPQRKLCRLKSVSPTTPTHQHPETNLTVYANQDLPGLDTGIDLISGSNVTITSSGQAAFGTGDPSNCSTTEQTIPDGQRITSGGSFCDPKYDPSAVLSSAPVGELLAQIGSSGWFAVGSSDGFTSATSGRLFLLYNDVSGEYGDNSGSYQATVTVTNTCPSSSLSVQYVFTQNGNGQAQSNFAQGDSIQYVVDVNNSCSSPINAQFLFQDFWGTINELPLEIFDASYQNITLPVGLSGWYVSTTVPPYALPGSYTDQVTIADMNNPQDSSTGTGSFTVTGTVQLGIPYYKQYEGQYAQNYDCGPASVAMTLSYYGRGPGGSGTALTQIRKIATGSDTRTNTNATQLETALSHYGSSYSTISRSQQPSPTIQITDIAAAIAQQQPIIGLINAFDFGRSYNGHWLVVVGFYNDGTNTYVILNDPDNQKPRSGYQNWIRGGADIHVLLSIFTQAEYDAGGGPYGIIVTS